MSEAARIGEMIGKGRFKLLKSLGRGTFGDVYLAESLDPQATAGRREAVIKVLHTQWAKVPEVVERFRREARICQKLRHPGIVSVTDHGVEDGELTARPLRRLTKEAAAIASGEEPPVLSDGTLLLLERAAEGFRVTHGRFDATRLDAVTAAGYVRSLDRHGPSPLATTGSTPEVGFDPGGIGKGLAADIITAELMSDGAAGALVSIGGDLRVRGVAPGGRAPRE